MQSRAEQAARNNAIWCDTVCRAHGFPGEFHDSLWLNRHPVPRFYPNVVTLADEHRSAEQLTHIRDLIAADLPGSWAVKDSFSTLDLAALDFQPLFDATWIWREPSRPIPDAAVAGIRWIRIHDAPELAIWETAWNGSPEDDPSAPQPRVFLPSLLDDQDIVFIAAYRDQQIVAGAIAHRTGDVVGLSNVFAPAENTVSFWAGCVTTAHNCFPGLPLVSYGHGRELAIAQASGFELLLSLRVWVR